MCVYMYIGFPGGVSGKEPLATTRDIETWSWSLGWEDPVEESKKSILVFLPEESHGKKSQVGYGAEGHN